MKKAYLVSFPGKKEQVFNSASVAGMFPEISRSPNSAYHDGVDRLFDNLKLKKIIMITEVGEEIVIKKV